MQKRFVIIGFLLLPSLLIPWHISFSEEDEQGALNTIAEDVSEKIEEEVGGCADAGDQWRQFLDSSVTTMNIFSSMGDLSKNYCQVQDLQAVEKQVENAKRALQNAFYKCNPDAIEKAKKDYYRVKMEQSYVRLFIECSENENCLFEKSELEEIPEDIVRIGLQAEYVFDKDWFDTEEFDELFKEFQTKYSDRFSAYQDCNPGDWSRVKEKFQNFWDTIKQMGSKEIDKREKMREQRHEQGEVSMSDLKNRPKELLKETLSKKVEFTSNRVEPEKRIDEIIEGFQSIYPAGVPESDYYTEKTEEFVGISSKAPTFTDIDLARIVEENRYTSEALAAEMHAKYEILYGETADNVTQLLVDDLEVLRETIHATFDPMQNIDQCTYRVELRQCMNK